MTLSGATAVVTGGTGALGGAIVRALLDEGARVDVPFRRDGELERFRESARIAADAPLAGALLDLTDENATRAFFERVAADRGRLDVLVNAAGGFAGGKPAHETPWSVWEEQIDLNLKTAVLASRAAAREMSKRRSGAIVNVSSRPAVQDGRFVAAYAASKRALLALTDAMAAELADSGITVNAILPSVIDTPANRAGSPDADPSRWVAPEDIARVVLFLAGPDARIVSGAHVPVYGRA